MKELPPPANSNTGELLLQMMQTVRKCNIFVIFLSSLVMR